MRYRGIYKAADGRYRSAGTFSTEERALAVAEEAERHAAELVDGAAGGLDPATRATRTIAEYAPLFVRHHQVEGNTKDTYSDTLRLHVIPFLGGCRLAETDRTVARNYITAQTVLFVDFNELNGQVGRTFRSIPLEVEPIVANLSLANMDFAEFAGNTNPDGIFCGF